MWAFLWVDRWEPEPPRTLLFAFLWGACVAALSALLINSSAVLVADAVLGQGSGDVLGASVIAPIVEEGVKGAFVVGLLIFRRREFDGIVDGIVYAGLVGAGFAFTENILYMGRAFAEDGRPGRAGRRRCSRCSSCAGSSRRSRTRCSPSMTGIGCGLAAVSRSRGGPGAVRAGRLRAGGGAARAVEQLGHAGRRRGVPRGLPLHHGAAVPRHDRPGRLAAAPRAAHRRGPAPGFAMAGWIAPSEVALLSTPGRAQPLAARGAAALGQGARRRPSASTRRPSPSWRSCGPG